MDIARNVVLQILYKIDKEQAYSNIALNEELQKNKNKLTQKDIALISEIVYGVTTWKLTLDEIIKKHSKIKLKKISPWIINTIRMGAYQIIFLDKIPKSAAVNESVNLAKRYGHRGSSSFTNAILRKIDKSDYEELLKIEEKTEQISKTTSMPIWIVQELLKQYNLKEVEKICKNSNLRPNIIIRINTLKTTKNELKQKLEKENIKCEETELEDFLTVKNLKNIENVSLFKNGYFTIQDLSAGMSAMVLNPKEGESVLDACSSPGGKTTYLAEIMKNTGKIEAWDIHEHRVNLVKQNAQRLGIKIIDSKTNDATQFKPEYEEKFDKILLDVPCLGLGVIKRKPDIKWHRKKEDIEEITKLQFNILNNCSKYLKKGGELVYSTCSILKEENQDIIERFLKENKNFTYSKYENIKQYNAIKTYINQSKYININTDIDHDGFFICKIVKK